MNAATGSGINQPVFCAAYSMSKRGNMLPIISLREDPGVAQVAREQG